MDDAKALGFVLSRYTDTHYYQVLVAYFSTYVLYPFVNAMLWHNAMLAITVCQFCLSFCVYFRHNSFVWNYAQVHDSPNFPLFALRQMQTSLIYLGTYQWCLTLSLPLWVLVLVLIFFWGGGQSLLTSLIPTDVWIDKHLDIQAVNK